MPRPTVTCHSCHCDRQHEGRGLCSPCYQRHRRSGTLGDFTTTLHYSLDAWLAEIDRSDPDACWGWPGSLNEDGYGLAWVAPRMHPAHRAVYRHLIGAIPEGMTLDHICHDSAVCREGAQCPHRRCVNPQHLVPSTHIVNTRRSLADRATCSRGHAQTVDNMYRRDGRTWCKPCLRAAARQNDQTSRLAQGLRVHRKRGACINDHDLTPENTYVDPRTGGMECRICRRAATRRRDAKRRAERKRKALP